MFKKMSMMQASQRQSVEILVNGQPVTAVDGEILALALLNAGVVPFRRTAISGQPRAPLCLMGVCFDCLLDVDGMQNVQSCMVQVQAGMQVRLPEGAPPVMDSK